MCPLFSVTKTSFSLNSIPTENGQNEIKYHQKVHQVLHCWNIVISFVGTGFEPRIYSRPAGLRGTGYGVEGYGYGTTPSGPAGDPCSSLNNASGESFSTMSNEHERRDGTKAGARTSQCDEADVVHARRVVHVILDGASIDDGWKRDRKFRSASVRLESIEAGMPSLIAAPSESHMPPTAFCQRCSFGPTEPRDEGATSDSRSRLRARLAALNALIDTLVAERLRLQAEVDSIVYPVLTLPTEITVQIFRHALPPSPDPSPLAAPLLLGQICRQWREIALNSHELWQSLSFSNHRSIALLQMWLSRSGNSPLNYSIACSDPVAADALIDTSLQHSHRWEDVTSGLPFTSFSRLAIRTLPILRRIAVQLFQKTLGEGAPDVLSDGVIIADAPLLRAVHIGTNFDLPWSQLTSLVVDSNLNVGECMDLLPKCPALVELTVSTYDADVSSARTHPHITLNSLESLSVNLGPSSVLQFLTLPHLRVLSLTSDLDHHTPDALTSLIRRSSCTLQQLTLALFGMAVDQLPALLLAVPRSVARLELGWGYKHSTREFFDALSAPNVLQDLKTLCFRTTRLLSTDFTAVADMLHARRSPHLEQPSLESFEAQLHFRGVYSVSWKPPPAMLAALQVLAEDGLHIRIEVFSRARSDTTTVIESRENGLSWR
ncbi:hypothetical protein C8J57DRAFT_1473122 [Mycena rebaudengoi]|nr:hypothetical protein C8J57DRAFT_1473122 [Mycena rebaudengoi]